MRNPEIEHNPKWFSVADASVELGIRDDTFWQAMHGYRKRGETVEWLRGKKVDTEYLLTLHAERARLWNLSHEYYYYISYTAGIRDSEMARSLHKYTGRGVTSWGVYLCTNMFNRVDEISLMNTTMSDRMLDFIKWAEHIIPKIEGSIIENDRTREKYELGASARVSDRAPRISLTEFV